MDLPKNDADLDSLEQAPRSRQDLGPGIRNHGLLSVYGVRLVVVVLAVVVVARMISG